MTWTELVSYLCLVGLCDCSPIMVVLSAAQHCVGAKNHDRHYHQKWLGTRWRLPWLFVQTPWWGRSCVSLDACLWWCLWKLYHNRNMATWPGWDVNFHPRQKHGTWNSSATITYWCGNVLSPDWDDPIFPGQSHHQERRRSPRPKIRVGCSRSVDATTP